MSSAPAFPAVTLPAFPGPFSDRSPPYSAEAELAVLGGMLIDADALTRAIEVVDDSMFYREGNRRTYRAMVRIFERGDVIDPVTLAEELAVSGDLESVGGMAFLASLLDAVPTAANIEYHAKIVREKAVLRRLIEAATGIIQDTYANQGDLEDLLDHAEQKIFEIAQTHERKGFVWIKEILWPTFEKIEALQANASSVTGIPTGFHDLDELTAGFQPSDLIIVAARPSMGKCLAHDAEILLADGSLATIEEVCRRRQARLLTLDGAYRLALTEPSAFVDDGHKPTFRVTTRLGRQVETTLTHPFLTAGGWKPLGEITVGEAVAVPRRLDVFGGEALPECRVKLLGYLTGDAGAAGARPRAARADPRVRDDFTAAVDELGLPPVPLGEGGGAHAARPSPVAAFQTVWPAERGGGRRAARAGGVGTASVAHPAGGATLPGAELMKYVLAVVGLTREDLTRQVREVAERTERDRIRPLLEEAGLWGKGAAERFVPAPVFRLPREQLALFLNRLFAAGGWAAVTAAGEPRVGCAMVSRRLARQVQHLLLRFGVVAGVERRRGRRPGWRLEVADAESLRAFVREIGILGREAALEQVSAALEGGRAGADRDLVPAEVWDRVAAARGSEPWAALMRRAHLRGWADVQVGRPLSRRALRALASALESAELLALADGDVWWDEIVSIDPAGVRQVYDLTIPETHNFVADDVCVHNTAFTLNVAQHAAIVAKKPVAFFSLEMSKESLVQRVLCAEARVDASRLRRGRLLDDEYARLATAAGYLNTAPIYIDDTAGISVLEMRAKARRLKADRQDLALIIVDYLQLMVGKGKSENRQQEVSEISRALKALAKELDVPVVALSQLSRAVEQRPDKRPMMSDLRESGAIEQDADVIMFLYRPEYYYGPVDKEGNSLEGRAELIVGKQRNGATGKVDLMFLKEFTRFESFSPRGEGGGGF